MEQLKPCPFCGGIRTRFIAHRTDGDEQTRPYTYKKIICRDCRAETKWCVGTDAAIKAWNRRVTDVDNH